ncbi:hypothetical protein HC248_01917 [Polaromonas vacuolata]|uniref:Uncharacterized protein n=1 Tax=Polaromonas vacuolata TaxID=37448 RepID=A0A6H2H9R2_9BURK|nr:hypothetical protein [Polaromonas vacuolata]QJC56609.1 hypothetical protein HC248_01917 [Polaromonas vacuolata]
MGKFTEQMASLTESVVASRLQSILNVKGMLSEFDRAQSSMARQQKSILVAGCSTRIKQVNSMRQEHRETQSRMGRDLRSSLAQETNQNSTSVASMRARSFREHSAMAEAQQKQFTQDSQTRLKGNDRLMNELSVSCQNMAQALSQNLESFTLGIRNGTDVMLGRFKKAHGEMAGQLRKTLRANTAKIRNDVTELKRGCKEAQSELRTDMQVAAHMWRNRNNRDVAVLGQAALVATAADVRVFGVMEKAIENLELSAEAKLQPSTNQYLMSDEERVFQVLRANPNGISATQIGEQVSLHAMVVGKIMKDIIENGKAKRDDGTRLYTPS